MTTVLDLLDSAPADDPPRSGSDRSMTAVGRVLDVSTDGTRVTVTILDSAPIVLPATASTWTGVATAHILLDPGTGRPVHVLGPATPPAQVLPSLSELPWHQPAPTSRSVTRTVQAGWSSTWSPGGWGTFNAGRYGGSRDLYQGDAGTGPLVGLVSYGAQITSIGATRITHASLTITGNGSNRGTWTAVVQCADGAASGPTPSGPTAAGPVTGTNTSWIDVTALAEGLLAGRGLALIGGDYGGAFGVGESMSLTLTCEVPV